MKVLAVVNDWRAYGNDRLRRCFPICYEDFTPALPTEFPNNGQVFIVYGGDGLLTGQLVWCDPRVSDFFSGSLGSDESMYVCRETTDFSLVDDELQELLAVDEFNPQEDRFIRRIAGLVPTRVVYVANNGFIYGPYQTIDRSGDRWRIAPLDPSEAVSQIPEAVFRSQVNLVRGGQGPGGAYAAERSIIINPKGLEHLALEAETKIDCMPTERIPAWLATVTSGILDSAVIQSIESSLESASKVVPVPVPILNQRLERARGLVDTVQTLYAFRLSLVDQFIRTGEGQQLLDAHLARAEADYIGQRKGVWDKQLMSELASLQAQRAKAVSELDELRATHRREVEEHEKELQEFESLEKLVKNSIAENTEDLKTRLAELAPVWLIMSQQLGAVPTNENNTPSRPVTNIRTEPIRAVEPSEYQTVTNERALLQYVQAELRRRGRLIDYHSLANMYVCLKSGYLTLLAGHPGVGKSSLARLVMDVLGHRSRMLPVYVQRGWSDDRVLMGYYNSLHDRYEPSTVGLVEHLLRAQDDFKNDLGGLYTVLFEEMNLSPVEHYLARFLSVMEAENAERTLILYQEAYSPANHACYPQRLVVPDNLRFMGTVNIDYTTESLSPRLLDRANLVWMQPQEFSEGEIPESVVQESIPQIGPISFRQLQQDYVKRPSEEDFKRTRADIAEIEAALSSRGPDLSPPVFLSPRTVKAIARYVVNSDGLMERVHALDFQIQQRLLPQLSGLGRKYEKRLEQLLKVIRPYERSRARLQEILDLGSEDGEYAFFKL